jgi:hypothetical protein
MRNILIAVVVITSMSLDACPVRAQEGPWCAIIEVGDGAVYEDCQYHSFEECRPNVLAGNRGFCNPNPRWTAAPVERRHYRKRQGRPP